jgi:hypothetical protein
LESFSAVPEQEPAAEDESAANEEAKPPELDSATRYRFDPDLKRYWIQSDSEIVLFIAGQSLTASGLSAAIAESFCSAETVVPDDWTTVLPALAPVLKDLLTRGLLERDD